MQRAVLDFSAVNFLNQRGCTSGHAHTSPKKVPTEPLPEGPEVDMLPSQRWDVDMKLQPAVYCLEAVLTKYLKWLAAKYTLWEGVFHFKAIFLSDQSTGVMTSCWTGVTRGKRHKDELLAIAKSSDAVLKMSNSFKLPPLSGKCFKPHVCKSLSVLVLPYPNH